MPAEDINERNAEGHENARNDMAVQKNVTTSPVIAKMIRWYKVLSTIPTAAPAYSDRHIAASPYLFPR